jgi:hypothetical protein
MTTREQRLTEDVRLLFDLLAGLPWLPGDLAEGDGWDDNAWPAKFWIDYAASYKEGTPPKDWAGADLAMYCLMFFSQPDNERACESVGSRFAGNFRVPEGDAAAGRRWIEQVLPVCWRIALGVRKDRPVLVPSHQVDPPTKLDL